MKSNNHQEIHKQICDFMGEDLDAPICKEVADHLEECPNCRVYLDTVRKTVILCRDAEKEQHLPDDVKNRLFKVLNLGDQSR